MRRLRSFTCECCGAAFQTDDRRARRFCGHRCADQANRKQYDVDRDFWAKVDKSRNCWRWTGYIAETGYGKLYFRSRRPILAHRFSYELAFGPIPQGLHLDHLCRNRWCVNPDHLEAVTPAVNIRRGAKAGKMICLRGHLLTGDNIRIRSNGSRICRKCDVIRTRKYKALRRILHPVSVGGIVK